MSRKRKLQMLKATIHQNFIIYNSHLKHTHFFSNNKNTNQIQKGNDQ